MKVGILGYGVFGQFMCSYLKRDAELVVWNRTDRKAEITRVGLTPATIEEVLAQPVIIMGLAVQAQEVFWKEHGSKVNPEAVVIDVSSVKTKPIKLMEQFLPHSCQIIATHPLFGPQSGKNGIEGLPIVVWPVRVSDEQFAKLIAYLEKLKLRVIKLSPDDHDKQMAYVQALTFFIGRAIGRMNIPDTELATKTYQHLFDIEQIVKKDTDDLFLTIQHENPYADAVRRELMQRLGDVEKELS